ncbi:sensor of ECF-type sigma factor [Psychroserpens sp. S379A]|uniref:sensor of ECF-type sigma factor n=1 Tax=Psychroserpens sp. S379A TaxID=3415137 RepID=UPI003C7E8419
MKKTIITIVFIVLALNVFSQQKERREHIKALKIAFITEELELTEDEAQKFWPIYNAHEKEMEMLRLNAREKRHNLNLESLSETEAKKALVDMLNFESELQNKKSDLVESLLTAIPAKKVLKLHLTEEAFKKRMLKEMRNRREKFKRN